MKMGTMELWYLFVISVRYILESIFFAVGICAFLRYLKLHPKDKSDK